MSKGFVEPFQSPAMKRVHCQIQRGKMMTNITQRPISNHDKDQRQEGELRLAILDKKQEQIKDWSNHIENLQQTLESAPPVLRIETEKRVTDLTDARDQAFAKVESLKPETH
jgi:hypothetical protein